MNEAFGAITALAAASNAYGYITDGSPFYGASCVFFMLLSIIMGTDHK